MNSGGQISNAGAGHLICMQCQEKKLVLKYIFPTQGGKKEFCSVPCLTAYRQDQKNRSGVGTNGTNSNSINHTNSANSISPLTTVETPPKQSIERCGISPTGSQSGRSSDEGPSFSWKEYLSQTQSEAAPQSNFNHSKQFPSNDFEIGEILEVSESNSRFVCLAEVTDTIGPRIGLEYVGSTSASEFWRLCDSEDLQQCGFAKSKGKLICPPTGFIYDSSRWPKFMEKTMQTATAATLDRFKTPPPIPNRNMFIIGQKLEAIDRKNPHLICCATVEAVSNEMIHVTFDGWKGAFDYWCRYDSRDIFPVGWCASSNHPLQPPGQKLYPGKAKINVDIPNTSTSPCHSLDSSFSNRSVNDNSNANSLNGSPNAIVTTSVNTTTAMAQTTSTHSVTTTSQGDVIDHYGLPNVSEANQNVSTIQKPDDAASNISSSNNDKNSTYSSKKDSLSAPKDFTSPLSIESRPISPKNGIKNMDDIAGNPTPPSSTVSSDNLPLSLLQTNIMILVNKIKSHASSLGPFLDPKKVQALPPRFGPGSINRVLRKAVQELVDASIDQKQVFGLLRQGDGKVIITASFEDKMQTIRLPAIESEESLWDFIEILFEELRCECFYEKGKSVNLLNGSQDAISEKFQNHTSPSNFIMNLENEPLLGKTKRRISETGSETTSEENFESGPPLSKKHQRPLMTTLSFNASAAKAISYDKTMRHSTPVGKDGEEIHRKPKFKKSRSPSNDPSKPRGRPPGTKSKDRHSNGEIKYKSPKHKSKSHSISKFSSHTSNQLAGHDRQMQPVSPSKRLPIYHNAHKMFQEHQLQKQHDLVTAAQQQINGSNASNANLPPPTLLPEVPTTSATITSSQAQTKYPSTKHYHGSSADFGGASFSDPSKHNSSIRISPTVTKKPAPVKDLSANPSEWTVDQVVRHLSYLDPTLAPHVEMFRTHEIDGKALLLLKDEMMMKYMDMKLGPALKISNIVNLIQGKKHQPLPK